MGAIADEIAALPSGARFFRADLHIHSFQASHDVKDTTMTPPAIVDTALSERLGLIAITDHNEIHNVNAALTAAAGKPLLVVPGVELSTPEGHLLAYFSEFAGLEAQSRDRGGAVRKPLATSGRPPDRKCAAHGHERCVPSC